MARLPPFIFSFTPLNAPICNRQALAGTIKEETYDAMAHQLSCELILSVSKQKLCAHSVAILRSQFRSEQQNNPSLRSPGYKRRPAIIQ
jgi:hypothetical protein